MVYIVTAVLKVLKVNYLADSTGSYHRADDTKDSWISKLCTKLSSFGVHLEGPLNIFIQLYNSLKINL